MKENSGGNDWTGGRIGEVGESSALAPHWPVVGSIFLYVPVFPSAAPITSFDPAGAEGGRWAGGGGKEGNEMLGSNPRGSFHSIAG